ncbi:Bacterial alpha-L-rhamnosidase 6 hairpin glycosidase domain [Phytophthora infestans]|uniref:Bacterial alpha-L-rhamnosidase 6 hairpin glycosidase domain n=1 Tax=Phytophthora infestans TaxID=4787 RepID=A0A833SQU7_PHYIN|nr:Bacterial alpha-L-rhamnosidase 6 hairpin glycosidase domain [Phytophthora infestans]
MLDGAKRDRTPWPGDYGVATLSKAVSLNGDDLVSVRNALQSIIAIQASNGKFPYAGTLLGLGYQDAGTNSDTYHLWTLSALLLGKYGVESNGGKNTAASSLLYDALVSYVQLADALGYGELNYQGKTFSKIAEDLKSAVNSQLWDDSVGLFRDNTTALGAEFYPQDGNVLAVHFNVTDSLERAATISHSLTARWNEFGAVSPETLGSISPFMTSLEIDAHLRAHPSYATLATAIMRRQWSYMLNNFGKSTTMEAFYYTGELKCPFYEAVETNLGSYISHAHSWSTGMTASLTLHIGGLNPVEDAGRTWEFVLHAAGATTITTPQDTTGSISVPTLGKSLETIEISVNGNAIWSNSTALWDGFGFAEGSNDYVTVSDVPSGGSFTIVAKEVSANTATYC